MICTFYSYKGGVGRSMAMANVADVLARRGLRVLMVDFDLEAPGIERFFQVNQDFVLRRPGLLDLVLAYKRGMSVAGSDTSEFKDLKRFICPIYEKLSSGCLDLMPAGRRHSPEQLARYALELRTLDWQDFYFRWQGELFFEWIRRSLSADYDLVLVDSRTGVTEMGGICGYQLPDAIVMMCAANNQNVEGTRNMLRDFRSPAVEGLRRGRPLQIVVVPARIEQHDPELLHEFYQRFDREFSNLLPGELAVHGQTFRELMVPYEPEFAFEERVVTDPTRYAERKRIGGAFERLAEAVCLLADPESALAKTSKLRRPSKSATESGRTPSPAVAESAPAAAASPVEPAYDVTRRFAGYDVFIDSSSLDRELAERVASYLQTRGLQVFYDRNDLSPGEQWESVVVEALFYSHALVVCLGDQPLTEWRKKTLTRARENQHVRRFLVMCGSGPDTSLDAFADFEIIRLAENDESAGLALLAERLRSDRPAASVESAPIEPFPGLQPFGEEHKNLFFGREKTIEQLLELLEQQPIMAVSGASGSGKSSLVFAGLVPRLRQQHGVSLRVDLLRLDSEPSLALDAVLASPAPASTSRRLLVIDQYEDLFTLCSDAERVGFSERLRALRERMGAMLQVLLIVRSDFADRLDPSGPLHVPSEAHVSLGAMTESELRAALLAPAERAGLAFEPGLAERILEAMRSEPNALPLLQAVLRELWRRRREGWLTNAAYDAIGGVQGLGAQMAQEAYEALDEAERKALRALVLGLVIVDSSGRYGRSLVRLDALRPPAAEHDPEVASTFERTVAAMSSAGVLRVCVQGGELSVELAHESLLQGWPLLHEWLDSQHELLLERQALRIAQRVWLDSQRSKGALLHGALLHAAERRVKAEPESLTLGLVQYVNESLAARQRARFLWTSGIFFVIGVAGWIAMAIQTSHRLTAERDRDLLLLSSARGEAMEASVQREKAQADALESRFQLRREEAVKLAAQGQFNDAVRKYDEALEIRPDSADTRFQRGLTDLAAGDKAAAEADVSAAIEHAASPAALVTYYLKRGDIRSSAGRESEAIADYVEATQVGPGNANAWFALGRAHERVANQEPDAGRSREAALLAVEAYSDALTKNPEFGEALFNRGAVRERLGDRAGAAKDFGAVAKLTSAAITLRQASAVRASKLGPKVVAEKPITQVYVQYSDPNDKEAVDKLIAAIRSPAFKIMGAQRVLFTRAPDVRFFFSDDEAAANELKAQLQEQLTRRGTALRVNVASFESLHLPKAKPGVIEVWLPPLSTSVPTPVQGSMPFGGIKAQAGTDLDLY